MSFFRNLFSSKKPEITFRRIELSENDKIKIKRDLEYSQKHLVIPGKATEFIDSYAIPNRYLKKYEFINKEVESELTSLRTKDVQKRLIRRTSDRLSKSYTKILSKLNVEKVQNANEADSADYDKQDQEINDLRIRTLKFNVTSELAERLNLKDKPVQTIKFGELKKTLNTGTKLTSNEQKKEYITRNSSDIKERRKKSDVKDYEKLQELLNHKSPINNTSYKDFRSLQIAWESVWTEAGLGRNKTFNQIPKIPEYVQRMLPEISMEEWSRYVIWAEKVGSSWVTADEDAAIYQMLSFFIRVLQGSQNAYSILEEVERVQNKYERDGLVFLLFEAQNLKDRLTNKQIELSELLKKTEENLAIIKATGLLTDYIVTSGLWELHTDYSIESSQLQTDIFFAKSDLNKKVNEYSLRRQKIQEQTRSIIKSANENEETGDAIYFTSDVGYEFSIFAPGHVNYGLLTTYRQFWTPERWQVGELIKTIPLTAGETRKYTKKIKQLKKRSRKEIENNSSRTSREDQSQREAKQEIMDRTLDKTAFEANAEGGNGSGGASAGFSISSEKESKDTKNNIRGATLKALEEVKREHKVEINDEESYETDFTEEGTLKNPNDAITVTYLFYELERAYEIQESLHELESVILIPNEVPAKGEINWDWIRKYHWILKRVILDIDFREPLNLAMLGRDSINEVKSQMRKKLDKMHSLIDKVTNKLDTLSDEADSAQANADFASQAIRSIMEAENNEGMFEKIGEWFGGGDDEDMEAAEYEYQQAVARVNRVQEEIMAQEGKLKQAQNAMDRATDDYNKAQSEANKKINKVGVLIEHIQDNILYYMQQIWSYEYADQRYMRLFPEKVQFVPYPEDAADIYIRPVRPVSAGDIIEEGTTVEVILPPPGEPVERPLNEIADLENLLGFKGNYMIFPLKEQTYITAYMSQSYLSGVLDSFDSLEEESEEPMNLEDLLNAEAFGFEAEAVSTQAFNLNDPDRYSVPATTVQEYLNSLEEEDPVKERLEDYLKRMKNQGTSEPEIIVVPTGSLYVESLPGKTSILEPFKEDHRKKDLIKAENANILDNLEIKRRKALLEAGEIKHDPKIDKYIKVETNGAVNNTITP